MWQWVKDNGVVWLLAALTWVLLALFYAMGYAQGRDDGWAAAWWDRTEWYKANYIPKDRAVMPSAED